MAEADTTQNLPTSEELESKLSHLFKLLGEPKQHTARVQSFQIQYAKEKNAEEDDKHVWGALELGLTTLMDVEHQHVRYRQMKLKSEWVDISSSTRIETDIDDIAAPIKYIKHYDAASPFAFTINVHNYGTDNAYLEGEVHNPERTLYIDGVASMGPAEIDTITYHADIQAPDGVEGSLQELVNISPMDWVEVTRPMGDIKDADGKPKDEKDIDKTPVVQRMWVDAVQKKGDEMIQTMMFYAIDTKYKAALLPSLPDISEVQRKLVEENKAFLRRGGIHLLTEQIKNVDGVDNDIKGKIHDKFKWYIKMMTTEEKPPEGEEDPVREYGWSWKCPKDMKNLADLKVQFRRLVTRCYEEAYKEKIPAWNQYLRHPVYWYERLAVYLISPPHMDRWLSELTGAGRVDKSGSELSAGKQINLWTSKLDLLKDAAETQSKASGKEMPKNLDVKEVHDYLGLKAHESIAMWQIIDEKFIEDLKARWEKVKDSPEYKILKDKIEKDASDAAKIQNDLMMNLGDKFTTMFNPKVGLKSTILQYKKLRLPPGTTAEISAREIMDFLEYHDINGIKLEALFDESPPPTTWQKIKSNAGKAKRITLKGILYFGVMAGFIYSLVSGNFSNMDKLEIIGSISGAVAVMIEGAGRLARFAITKIASTLNGNFIRPIMKWLMDYQFNVKSWAGRLVSVVAGNLGRLVRSVVFIGAIIGLYLSWREMQKTSDDPDQISHKFATIQFWLSVVETSAMMATILLEFFGYGETMIAVACGWLGAAVGVAAIIVVVVYLIWFRPDPLKDAKDFLEHNGKEMGAYE